MAPYKNNTWQKWKQTNMTPTKHGALENGTPYQNAQILYFPRTELSDF